MCGRKSDTSLVVSQAELLAGVRAARERLAGAGPDRSRRPGDFERVSLPSADGDVLRDLLVSEGARAVIEVGLAYGASALAIAEALVATGAGRGRHLIVDAYQGDFADEGWKVLAKAGLGTICTLLRERSELVLPRLLAEGVVVDAAFVDASHLFHNVFRDLCYLHELVRPGGLVVLDDCDWPSVATAARYFELNLAWHREPAGRPTRLRPYRLPDPRPEPAFDSFVPFGADGAT